MKWISDKKIVAKTPIVTVILLEFANIGQIINIIKEKSSTDHSLVSWILVCLALILWLNFYRVICPEQKIAFYSTLVGIFINLSLIFTIIYFR